MEQVVTAFIHMLSPVPLMYMTAGVFLGIVVGAVPGLSGSMLIALSLPLTFYMDSTNALTLLISEHIGAMTGGLITAILLRMPGTAASVVTTFDGYPMAKKGLAGRAIGVGIISSFVGGNISWVFLLLLAPPLASLALKFGPFEFFSLVLMALVLIASVGQGEFLKGLISGALGLLVACPGLDPVLGMSRLDFGFSEMAEGFGLLPVLIGLFGISQLIKDASNIRQVYEKNTMIFKEMFFSLKEFKSHVGNMIRSSFLGTWIGILPGIGANIGSIVAYTAAKNASKTPEKFGTGFEGGIVASEAANNANICGALIPLITLGIPGNPVDAILLGALTLHDLTPGPLLFKNNGPVVYGVMAAAFYANIIMFILTVGMTVYIAKITNILKSILIPVIVAFCVLGTFALGNRMFDVWVMFGFGLVGFLLEKAGIPLGPFVIGIILCPIAEEKIRSGLMLSMGSFMPLFTRPLSLFFVLVAIGVLIWSLRNEYLIHKKKKKGGLI